MTDAVKAPPGLKAFDFLKDEALEAHHRGDGIGVLHLCHVVLWHIEKAKDSIPQTACTLENLRWSVILALYWAIHDWTLMTVRDVLKKLQPADESLLSWDYRLATHALRLLDDPWDAGKSTELLCLPAEWAHQHSASWEDALLLTYIIELTWLQDPHGEEWQNLASAWAAVSPADSSLQKSILDVLGRLRYQTFLTTGQWPVGVEQNARHKEDHPLARAFELYMDCNWKLLDDQICELVPRINIGEPSYFGLFHLMHTSRMRRARSEDQFVSLPRYYCAASRNLQQVHETFCEKHFHTKVLEVLAKGTCGGGGTRAECQRLAMMFELSALRRWDLVASLEAIRKQAEVALELVDAGESDFAVDAVLKSMRSLWIPDGAKNRRLQKAVYILDEKRSEKREEVVGQLLATRPKEWRAAYEVLSLISDAIPESLLLRTADWSARVATTPVDEFDVCSGRIAFWGEILGHVKDTDAVIECLAPALLHAAGDPRVWESCGKALTESLARGSWDIAARIAERLTLSATPSGPFHEHAWSIVYNACARRKELSELYGQWLRSHSGDRPERYHYLQRLDSGNAPGPIDDPAFREYLVEELLAFAAQVHRNQPTPFAMGGFNSRLIRLVTWPDQALEFVPDLLSAVEAPYGAPHEKLSLLQVLAEVVGLGPEPLVDKILIHTQRWLASPPDSVDPATIYSGPLSTITITGDAPEHLERGLWWLGYALLRRRHDRIRDIMYERVLRQALPARASWADVVFAISAHLIARASPGEDSRMMAIAAISQAIAASIETKDQVRLVGTFGAVLSGKGLAQISLMQAADREPAKMVLAFWERHLAALANASFPDVRAAVASSIRVWSGLQTESGSVPIPASLAEALARLKEDARARVRSACNSDD